MKAIPKKTQNLVLDCVGFPTLFSSCTRAVFSNIMPIVVQNLVFGCAGIRIFAAACIGHVFSHGLLRRRLRLLQICGAGFAKKASFESRSAYPSCRTKKRGASLSNPQVFNFLGYILFALLFSLPLCAEEYPRKLKTWFWTASAFPRFFRPALGPCSRTLSLVQDKKSVEPPCPIPKFSVSLGISVEEKLAAAEREPPSELESLAAECNARLLRLRSELADCYAQAQEVWESNLGEDLLKDLLVHINALKVEIQQVEYSWRESAARENRAQGEEFTPWDLEEMSLFQFVIEFGSQEHLYIMPPELASMKLNITSGIPVPRASWTDFVEIVLEQQGIGVKVLSPLVRALYLVKQEPAFVGAIASRPEDLIHVSEQKRVFYVFSPPPEQCKTVLHFFERFADSKASVYPLGVKIALVASKKEIEKLLSLYNAVWEEAQGKTVRVIPVRKIPVKEMERLLLSFFGETMDKMRAFNKQEGDPLQVFALEQGNAVVCMGSSDVVERAEKIVHDTEEQLKDPAEMTISLYHCKHSSPEDLAKVLEKVYLSLAATSSPKETDVNYSSTGPQFKAPPEGYPPAAPLVVAPPPINVANKASVDITQDASEHFIPDPKTGSILMVIRRDVCAKVKELLKRLDVPKRMVQLEMLLFEKRLNCETNFGLNLLKFASKHSDLFFHTNNAPQGSGVLQYLLHRNHGKSFPAYDVLYSFLMTQDDIQLNAAPSTVTVNQTPVQISIVEEISINNGAAPMDTNKGIAFEKSYTRAQYGITINVTPTIHLDEGDDQEGDRGCVTLKTNVTFDTTRPGQDDRPLVDRRHVENEVRIADGETVILGGLRRKTSQDREDRIPLLGDIPGIGKLFGSTKLLNHNTEMFIFITPKIILDPKEELLKIREQELKKRPGEIPEFLQRMQEAEQKERERGLVHMFKNAWL